MGTGAAAWIVPAIISAVGTGASVYNTRQVAKEQDRMAARGIRQQQDKQREIDERLSGEIDSLENSSPEDEQAKSMAEFMTQLRATRGNAEGAMTPGGERYSADAETSKAAIGNYGTKLADILSRVRAPGEQRRNEAFSFNRAGGDVAGIAREASGADFLNRLRMSGIQRNPWLDAGGQVVQGIAGGMALNSGAEIDPGTLEQVTRQGNEGVRKVGYGIGGVGGGAIPPGMTRGSVFGGGRIPPG